MVKKEIILVSVFEEGAINPDFTKAFTNNYEAEEYFIDLVGKELSAYYDDYENDSKKNEIDSCLDLGYYTNGHEYGTTISISEIELYDDN